MTKRLLYCASKLLDGLAFAVLLCFKNSHNDKSIRSYTAFCSLGTGFFFLRLKKTGHHVDHLLLPSAKFKKEWSHIYISVAFSGKEMYKYTLIK
jgi:hypothetical protein